MCECLIPSAGKNFTGSLPVFLLSWRYSFITYDGILISKESGARNLTVLSERISKIDISVVGSNYKLSQYYKIYFLCYGDFGGGVVSRSTVEISFTHFYLFFFIFRWGINEYMFFKISIGWQVPALWGQMDPKCQVESISGHIFVRHFHILIIFDHMIANGDTKKSINPNDLD